MAPTPGSAHKRQRQSISVMDECVAEFIKRMVLRMSLAESMDILKAWGFLRERDLDSLIMRTSKENLAMQVVQLCEKRKATISHAADLDIIYNHSNTKKKSWEVYQMSTSSDSEMILVDVSEMKVQFEKTIRVVTKNVTIHFKDFGDALWIRIAWGRNYMKPNEYKPTFVVYHSQTPYAFITNLTKAYRPLLCQALLCAAGYSQIQEMELRSRCLESLKDIVFKRFNQGATRCPWRRTGTKRITIQGLILNLFSRWEKSTGNPHLVALYHEQLFDQPFQSYQPRSLQERKVTPAIVDPRITCENIKEIERIHHLTRETFGDGSLPKIEYASYKLETSFKGENGLADGIEPFRCLIKFSSPHLLDSIRSLAPAGIAEAPVSSLLSCIPHRARNVFKISEKKPTHSQAAN